MHALLLLNFLFQPTKDVQIVLKEKWFPEPRLIIFADVGSSTAQGFIVAEKQILFEVDDFSVIKGITCLIVTYYVFNVKYPKSLAASSFLLFIQEYLLEKCDTKTKHTAKYNAFVNFILN